MSIEEVRSLFNNHTYVEKSTSVRYTFYREHLYISSTSPYEGEFSVIEKDGKFYLITNPRLNDDDLEIIKDHNRIFLNHPTDIILFPFAELIED